MSKIYRAALIIGCFFAAIACYVFGAPAGGVIFFAAGVIFEGLFWVGVLGKKKGLSSTVSK